MTGAPEGRCDKPGRQGTAGCGGVGLGRPVTPSCHTFPLLEGVGECSVDKTVKGTLFPGSGDPGVHGPSQRKGRMPR